MWYRSLPWERKFSPMGWEWTLSIVPSHQSSTEVVRVLSGASVINMCWKCLNLDLMATANSMWILSKRFRFSKVFYQRFWIWLWLLYHKHVFGSGLSKKGPRQENVLWLGSNAAQQTDPETHAGWIGPHHPPGHIVWIRVRNSSTGMDHISWQFWHKVPFIWYCQPYYSICCKQCILK